MAYEARNWDRLIHIGEPFGLDSTVDKPIILARLEDRDGIAWGLFQCKNPSCSNTFEASLSSVRYDERGCCDECRPGHLSQHEPGDIIGINELVEYTELRHYSDGHNRWFAIFKCCTEGCENTFETLVSKVSGQRRTLCKECYQKLGRKKQRETYARIREERPGENEYVDVQELINELDKKIARGDFSELEKTPYESYQNLEDDALIGKKQRHLIKKLDEYNADNRRLCIVECYAPDCNNAFVMPIHEALEDRRLYCDECRPNIQIQDKYDIGHIFDTGVSLDGYLNDEPHTHIGKFTCPKCHTTFHAPMHNVASGAIPGCESCFPRKRPINKWKPGTKIGPRQLEILQNPPGRDMILKCQENCPNCISKQFAVKPSNVQCGKTKSCGRYRAEFSKITQEEQRIPLDLTGQFFGDLEAEYPLSKRLRKMTKWHFFCHGCKKPYETYAFNVLDNGVICCPQCAAERRGAPESKGEVRVEQLLQELGYQFTRQETFRNSPQGSCVSVFSHKPLYFDFYIPSLNLCIEYDGEQHFRIAKRFGGVKKFKERYVNDRAKDAYCQLHNISLLRIPYTDFDKLAVDYLKTLIEETLSQNPAPSTASNSPLT